MNRVLTAARAYLVNLFHDTRESCEQDGNGKRKLRQRQRYALTLWGIERSREGAAVRDGSRCRACSASVSTVSFSVALLYPVIFFCSIGDHYHIVNK